MFPQQHTPPLSRILLATLPAAALSWFPAFTEAQTPYQQAVLDSSPVLYWTFDEAGDTDNARSLANEDPANELTPLGAASRAPSTTTAGGADLGRAASFDATADPQSRYHAVNLAPGTPLDSFAVEFWFQIDDAEGRYFSEMFGDDGTSNQPGVIYNFNPGEFELFAGGRTGTPVSPNEWHHVVAAFYGSGNGVEIYIDGGSAPLTDRGGGFSQVHGFGEFAIGNTVRNPQSVNGLIDEYAIYDLSLAGDLPARQLLVAALATHYAFGAATVDPNLAAPSARNFGAFPQDPPVIPLEVSVRNLGENETLNITGVTFSGADATRFALASENPFPNDLAPGETDFIRFTFNSEGQPGPYAAVAEIASNDPEQPVATVALSLSIQPPPPVPATPYQIAVVEDNPVLYWTFDESGDSDSARSLVNDDPANELIPQGAASRAPSTTTAGGADLGRAASFDSALDPQSRFHAANLSPSTPLETFAVEFWFNIDDAEGRYFSEMFAENGASNQPGVIYNFNPGEFELFSGPRSGTLVSANEWHHVVAAFYGPGDGVEIYLDGVSSPLIDRDGGFNQVHSFGRFAIGNTVLNPQCVNGLIDEYAIYDLGPLADLAARQAHVAGIAQHYDLSAAPFRIVEFSYTGDPAQAIIAWESQSNRYYAVDAASALSGWNQVMGGIRADSDLTSYTDSAIPVDEQDERYYRVRQTAPPPLLFSDFEDGPGDWTATTESGETNWELGTPAVPGLSAANSGVNAWGTDLDAPYGPNVAASLRSPLIDLASVAVPRLSFQYYIDSTPDVEGGQLRILDASGNPLFIFEQIFSGTTNGWTPFTLVLPPAVRDQQVIIEFLFLTDNDDAVGAGWYIDDVLIR